MYASSPATDRVVAASSGAQWTPESDSDKAAVRTQLERLLVNPAFKNSKRYPALLRFAVERVLEGHTDSLKERSLGVEVFHRDPNYDTNQDPVVRTTAVEVRKRLAQYYQDPQHDGEIRIEFPSGSYMPEFRLPVVVVPDEPPPVARKKRLELPRWAGMAAAAVGLTVALFWWSPWTPSNALDRFWSPVWNSTDHVLICVGGSGDARPVSAAVSPAVAAAAPGDLPAQGEEVPLAEAGAVARIVGQKMALGKTFHLRSHATTKFVDLRDGPVVLVGGFDNSWAVRLLDELHLRFHLERDGSTAWIADRQKPDQRNWAVNTRSNSARDYALISRVWNPGTGKEMVSIASLLSYGTGAAGEFLSERRYMDALAATMEKSWQNRNLQIVIGTKLTGASSGPPEVLAAYSWQ